MEDRPELEGPAPAEGPKVSKSEWPLPAVLEGEEDETGRACQGVSSRSWPRGTFREMSRSVRKPEGE